MTMKNKNLIFIDALTEVLGSSEGQSHEDIIAELREEGINVDIVLNRLLNSVKDISMEAKRNRLDFARENRLKLEKDKISIRDKFIGWTKDQLIEKIKENISFLGEDVGFAYRDLETQDTEDIRSLLEDLELARINQELDKKKDGR